METSKEMKIKLAERLKTVERHRQEVCEYLNTPSRLREEDVCKRVDNLCLQYRMVGKMENQIEIKEMLERKEKVDIAN